jgi:hypothetical protein
VKASTSAGAAAGAGAHLRHGRRAAPLGVEDVDDLCEQRDRRVRRDDVAAKPEWLPCAVPMLVKAADAVLDPDRKSHLRGDVGPAMAARLDEFAGNVAAVLQNVDDRSDALGQARLRAGVRKDEAQRGGEAAVDGFETALEADVVGEIERADSRGVATAAEVLEEQGVIEVGQCPPVETGRLADVHADPAGADAVAGRLALGHVERVAERADQLRQPHWWRVARASGIARPDHGISPSPGARMARRA